MGEDSRCQHHGTSQVVLFAAPCLLEECDRGSFESASGSRRGHTDVVSYEVHSIRADATNSAAVHSAKAHVLELMSFYRHAAYHLRDAAGNIDAPPEEYIHRFFRTYRRSRSHALALSSVHCSSSRSKLPVAGVPEELEAGCTNNMQCRRTWSKFSKSDLTTGEV